MSKYAALIQAAKKDESVSEEKVSVPVTPPAVQISVKPENQTQLNAKARERVTTLEEQVNLGIKVPLSWRRHWAAESKKTGVTMTEVIVEALTARFGKP